MGWEDPRHMEIIDFLERNGKKVEPWHGREPTTFAGSLSPSANLRPLSVNSSRSKGSSKRERRMRARSGPAPRERELSTSSRESGRSKRTRERGRSSSSSSSGSLGSERVHMRTWVRQAWCGEMEKWWAAQSAWYHGWSFISRKRGLGFLKDMVGPCHAVQ